MLKKIAQKSRLAQFYQTPEQLINILPIPAAIIHRSGTLLYLNHHFSELYQLTTKEMIGRKIQSFSDTMSKKTIAQFDNFDQGEDKCVLETFYVGRYYQMMMYPLFNQYKRVEAIYMLQWDISKIKRLQQMSNQNNKKSKEQLFFDPLTNIRNDYAIEEFITQKKQIESKDKVTIFFIKLDEFDAFNDEHGFLKANEALRQVASVLKEELRSDEDLLVKLTGDRFLIAMPELTQYTALTIAERLRNAIYNLNLQITNIENERLTISIIVDTLLISKIMSVNHLIYLLDDQLRMSKQKGSNRCFIYSSN